ncbi:MAG: carboxypeptidase regulatory-like domain-containing protein [Pyrinomonadaceae bacterium]
MKLNSTVRGMLTGLAVLLAALSFGITNLRAQSQALNGQIEGVVSDSNSAAVSGATVVARNVGTGTERTATTDSSGVYRFPLLPLGSYRVTVEAANFKRLIRDGITLVAGQTATVDLGLEVGGLENTVTITSDAPIADAAKIDLGRVLNTREIQDLPLVSRNPYNFSLLQANVVGRPNTEFGVPRVSANGYARRTNFQLDGNVNTQANSGGLRLVPISETFISEVQLVTNGFSAEFGQTPGLVMNNITPSGTNGIHGSGGYRFRRTAMSSRPFNSSPTSVKPPTTVDDLTAAIGGPIIKDRWHFYGGYEWVSRDFSGRPQQLVTITPANKAALIASGLSPSIFSDTIPASQKVNFFIFRTDAQITENHRLTGRFIRFTNFSPNNVGGGINTLERTVDLDDKSNSLAIQLASIFSPNVFNEFRYQRAHRNSIFLPTQYTPSTPFSVTITGVASFGAAANINAISPIETMNQIQNNLTWTKGSHTFKFGGGVNMVYDFRRSNVNATYTFPNLATYLNAVAPGASVDARTRYTSYAETIGDPEFEYNTEFYNFFVQDDWKATRKLKFNLGLRYDLYNIPDGIADAPLVQSKKFKVDKNNFAPRLGAVYALRGGDRPTVIRGSFGIYYDTVYLSQYEGALQENGVGRYANRTFTGRGSAGTTTPTAGYPTFSSTLGALPPGTVLPPPSIEVISSDFNNMYAMHFQTQLEQALTKDYSFTVGYIHSEGRQLAVYKQTNCTQTTATLADGRPKFNCGVGFRLNPNFQNIIEVGSGGNSHYNALTMQVSKRFSQGYQFSFNYTLSKVRDNAPERNLQGVGAASQSDPSNRDFDWAYGVADQRHTVSSSFVARPKFDIGNKVLSYIVNQNQFGFTAFAGSGETFPITTNTDLNGDGIGNDIPVDLERNAGRAPGFVNVDFRYSRVIPFTERFKLEVFAEASNIFNINSTLSYGSTTIGCTGTCATTGVLTNPVNYANFTRSAQESRQGQLGLKFIF